MAEQKQKLRRKGGSGGRGVARLLTHGRKSLGQLADLKTKNQKHTDAANIDDYNVALPFALSI